MRLFITMLLAFSIVACNTSDNKTIAKVNGESITLDDLKKEFPELENHLFKIKEAEYRALSSFVERAIADRVLKAEAKKLGISESELMEKEVKSKIKATTDKQARDFAKMRGMKEKDLKKIGIDKVKQFLDMQQERAVADMFMKQLKTKHSVDIKLEEPKRPKVEIKVSENDVVIGNKDADVTVVEFFSFQCGHCKHASKEIHKIIDEYKNKVRFVFKQFPLGGSTLAAEAALCAHEKGKFLEYESLAFENNRALDKNSLIKYATEIGLVSKDFSNCLSSGKYKTKVEENIEMGRNSGVNGVPTAFVNGEMLMGLSYDRLKNAIEKEL